MFTFAGVFLCGDCVATRACLTIALFFFFFGGSDGGAAGLWRVKQRVSYCGVKNNFISTPEDKNKTKQKNLPGFYLLTLVFVFLLLLVVVVVFVFVIFVGFFCFCFFKQPGRVPGPAAVVRPTSTRGASAGRPAVHASGSA